MGLGSPVSKLGEGIRDSSEEPPPSSSTNRDEANTFLLPLETTDLIVVADALLKARGRVSGSFKRFDLRVLLVR